MGLDYFDRPEDGTPPEPDIRDISQVLNELNVVQGEIDSLTNRKGRLIDEYHALSQRNQKLYDKIVNRPEPGEVAITRAERY